MGQFKRQSPSQGAGGERRSPNAPPVPGRRELVPIERIVEMLAARAHDLCVQLLPAGIKEGPEYRVGSVAGEPGRSMAVHLEGSRAGVWKDFSSIEDRGDALDLVAKVLFAGDKGEAIKWSRGWLGIDGTNYEQLRQTRRAVEARRAEEPDDRSRKNKAAAFAIYLSAQESILDTPVEYYLAGRAIDLAHLGRQPRALRYHPALWNRETDRKHPAMVAAISNHEGDLVAIHRTWLQQDEAGRWIKLVGVLDQKMTLGRFAGGAIRLWRGASRKSLKDAPDDETVILTEGIEDGLTLAMACPEYRILAAVSLANMGGLVLPRSIGTVILAADNDYGNPQAEEALDRAVRHFASEGRQVRIARSPVGKDMNDLLRGEG